MPAIVDVFALAERAAVLAHGRQVGWERPVLWCWLLVFFWCCLLHRVNKMSKLKKQTKKKYLGSCSRGGVIGWPCHFEELTDTRRLLLLGRGDGLGVEELERGQVKDNL